MDIVLGNGDSAYWLVASLVLLVAVGIGRWRRNPPF
jgi:hypothetical protein